MGAARAARRGESLSKEKKEKRCVAFTVRRFFSRPHAATALVPRVFCRASDTMSDVTAAIVLESLAASAQIGVLACVGAALARAGVLDARGRHTLSQCSYHVFIPSLSFIRLATAPRLGAAAVALSINMAAAVSVGAAVGYLAARASRPPPELRPLVWAAAALGNQANLPLVVVHALCQGKEARAALLPGSASTARECADAGAALILAPVWVASTMQFLIADSLLRPKASEDTATAPATELTPLPPSRPRPSLERDDSKLAKVLSDEAAGVVAAPRDGRPPEAETDALLAAAETATPRDAAAPSPSPVARFLTLATRALRAAAVPPSAAAVAGLIVGATPLRRALEGERAPLGLVTASLESLGGAMIPCLLVVLGAELAPGPGAARVPARAIGAAVATRLVIMPALGGAWLATRVLRFSTPLATVVAQLAWSTPSAVMLATLAVKHGAQPAAMAALLFWSYLVGAVTLPAVATILLRIV